MTSPASWLRCYRCSSQNLEVQVHYEGVLKVDTDSGEAVDPTDEVTTAGSLRDLTRECGALRFAGRWSSRGYGAASARVLSP